MDRGEATDNTTTGAEAVAQQLRQRGVDTVFCLPGEETIALLEAIVDVDIELVVARHEQHAAFMAATHGRLTGEPGVLVTTLGPGMTNAITGLAHATLGGFPVLHIAGQKPVRDNWEGSFQVVDLVATASPVVKRASRVTDAAEAATTVEAAWRLATSGRPGAVFVELPKDVAATEIPDTPTVVTRSSLPVVTDTTLDAIATLLDDAHTPVVLVGSGCQSAAIATALRRFVDASGVPVLALQMGAGVLPADHPLAIGQLPMHSLDAAHVPLDAADAILAVGFHPDEHPPLAWPTGDRAVAHLAAWPAPVRRGYQPDIDAPGDVADALDRLAGRAISVDGTRIAQLRSAVDQQLSGEDLIDADADGLAPITVVRAVREVLGTNDLVALDNGSYKLWFARHYATACVNGLMLDNALATMGAGLAVGTEAARQHPDRSVLAVVGDGGFMMNVGDLGTAVQSGLENLTILVLRDDTFGFIADHQRERGRERVAVDLQNPDLVELARSFGATAARVERAEDLVDTLGRARHRSGVVVIDCLLDEQADRRLHDLDSFDHARERFDR